MITKREVVERLLQSDRIKSQCEKLRAEIEKHLSECLDVPTSMCVDGYSSITLDTVVAEYRMSGEFETNWYAELTGQCRICFS